MTGKGVACHGVPTKRDGERYAAFPASVKAAPAGDDYRRRLRGFAHS